MNRWIAPVFACLLLCACAAGRVDTSQLPTSFFGQGVFIDDQAAYEAKVVFGGNTTYPTDAAKSARIMAVIEYLTGATNDNTYWSDLSGIVSVQMMMARAECRAALGVAPDARSQQIVDPLIAVSLTDDPAKQLAALSTPVFTMGPEATLARLKAMPPLPLTTRAVQQLSKFNNRLSTAEFY